MTEPATTTEQVAPVVIPEPLTVTIQETGAVVGFMCHDCALTHFIARQTSPDKDEAHDQAKLNAKRCCNRICDCGTLVEMRTLLYCNACRAKHEVEREQVRYKHAKKVSPLEYNGWIFADGYGDDGYFTSCEHLRDHCRIWGKQLPTYVWTCNALEFAMDADCIIDQALDEHHEDASDNISDAARGALQYMLDAWTEKQGIKSYFTDHDVAVVIPDEWIAESMKWPEEAAARKAQALETTEES